MSGSLVASLVFAALAFLLAREHGRQHQIFLHGFMHRIGPIYLDIRLRLLHLLLIVVFAAVAVWFMPSWIGRGLIIVGIPVSLIRGFNAADRQIGRSVKQTFLQDGMSEREATIQAEEWLKMSDRQAKFKRKMAKDFGSSD